MNSLNKVDLYSFNINNKTVKFEELSGLSQKTREIVEAHEFQPPRLDLNLKEYSPRIERIQKRTEEGFQMLAAMSAAMSMVGVGIIMIVLPIALGALEPALLAIGITLTAEGSGIYLYETSELGKRRRISKVQKQLEQEKQRFEETLKRVSSYYTHQGLYLEDALRKKIKKQGDHEELQTALKEIQNLHQQMAELGEEAHPKIYPTLKRAV